MTYFQEFLEHILDFCCEDKIIGGDLSLVLYLQNFIDETSLMIRGESCTPILCNTLGNRKT